MLNVAMQTDITPEQFNHSIVFVPKDTRKELLRTTKNVSVFRAGEEELALVGMMPLTLLSRSAVVWAMVVTDRPLTRRELLDARDWFEFIESIWGFDLFARVNNTRPVDLKFAKFFGFVPYEDEGDFTLFKRNV